MIAATITDLKLQWNSQAILTPAEKMQVRLLNGFGAYCMRVQRNSIKPASRPHQVADPGAPPLYHPVPLLNGLGYRSTIFFATDRIRKETSIGPVMLSGTKGSVGGQRVPEILENGGVALILRGTGFGRTRRSVNVRARPSAQPAFDKTVKKKLPELIAGGIMREV